MAEYQERLHAGDLLSRARKGQYPGSSYPPGTGAAASNSLGYDDDDSTYHLVFEVTHSSASLTVAVTGQGLQMSPDDEWWGIDNVRVTTR